MRLLYDIQGKIQTKNLARVLVDLIRNGVMMAYERALTEKQPMLRFAVLFIRIAIK